MKKEWGGGGGGVMMVVVVVGGGVQGEKWGAGEVKSESLAKG